MGIPLLTKLLVVLVLHDMSAAQANPVQPHTHYSDRTRNVKNASWMTSGLVR